MNQNWSTDNINSLEGKIIVVTGSNSGVGFEAAKVLAEKGGRVILACKDDQRGKQAENKIGHYAEYINLDLRDFKNINRFSEILKKRFKKIDILINNAGVMFPPFTKTNEGLELTFAVNYIGYYLLSLKLLNLMKDVRDSRVINVSSIAHYGVKSIEWDCLNSEQLYEKQKSYNLSNLFRIMLTLDLDHKFKIKKYKTKSISCHPGVAYTNLTRYLPKIIGKSTLTKIVFKLFFQSAFQGSLPLLMAATSEKVQGGDFVGIDSSNQFRGSPKVVNPNKLVFDKKIREILWQKSVQITGEDL